MKHWKDEFKRRERVVFVSIEGELTYKVRGMRFTELFLESEHTVSENYLIASKTILTGKRNDVFSMN